MKKFKYKMESNRISIKNDARKLFLKKGTCSAAFFHILNREFEQNLTEEVTASDILAGGISQQGYQCGMLWGTALAIGAEAFRRNRNVNQASVLALRASRDIVQSFSNRTGTPECSEITKTDWKNSRSIARYALTGKFMTCFNLARDWAPEAVETVYKSLDKSSSSPCLNCAQEALKASGAGEKEQVMVCGFGGGLGLSQNGCGALAAALWYQSLEIIRKNGKRPGLKNPEAEKLIKGFYEMTDFKMECSEITNVIFKDESDYSLYLKNGGCKNIISYLSEEIRNNLNQINAPESTGKEK